MIVAAIIAAFCLAFLVCVATGRIDAGRDFIRNAHLGFWIAFAGLALIVSLIVVGVTA